MLKEIPANRYQLVHDYLAEFVCQQQEPLKAQLEKEREQRQLIEKELKQLLNSRKHYSSISKNVGHR